MPSRSLPGIDKVKAAFPDLHFIAGQKASWNPQSRTATYVEGDFYGVIHEIAHAELGHSSFAHDIELLKMERDAWHLAKQLAKEKFNVEISDDFAEDCLDSYRDWLYKRSKCPQCQLVGFQTDKNTYSCPFCRIDWKVTSSRLCAVKRKILA